MSIISKASLVQIPSGYAEDKLYSEVPNTAAGDFTFTRASTGTRVNADGYIEEVPWNIFTDSQDFNLWGKSANVVLSNGYTSPINTNTAYAIEYDGTIAQYFITKNSVLVPSQNVTYSAYVKKGTKNWIILRVGNTCLQYMDIENFVLGSFVFAAPLSHSFEDVGNGWIRVSITVLGTGLSQNLNIYVAEGNGNPSVTGVLGNKLLYVWGGQLVKGDAPKPYIKTTNRLDIPRLDYSGGATCPTLLLEPQRTNNVAYSENYNDSYWTKFQCTVTSGQSSPSGDNSAYLMKETASGGLHRVIQTNNISFLGGQKYAYSLKVKYFNRKYIMLSIGGVTNNPVFEDRRIIVNLENGTIDTDTSYEATAKITPLTDGWLDVSFVMNAPSASVNNKFAVQTLDDSKNQSFTGDINKGVYIWGSQLEQGSFPTSYIPTLGTSVTRVAEFCNKTSISSLIGQTEGTFLLDFVYTGLYDNSLSFLTRLAENNTNTNRLGIYSTKSNDSIRAFCNSNNVSQFDAQIGTLIVGQRYKVAMRYKINDFSIYLNGTNVYTNISANVPLVLNDYVLGNIPNTSQFSNFCKTNQATLFNEALTDTELETLTTI